MMNVKKYSWTFDKRDDVWTSDTFDTVMECVEDAKKHIKHGTNAETIYVGENVLYEPYIDAVDVLQLVENSAHDQCGEVADDWRSYDGSNMKAELAELSSKLTLIIKEWLKKNNREPFFYSINNIQPVSLVEDIEEEKPAGRKPEACIACGRQEVCGLQEECCSEDGKSCDCCLPEGKEFLEHIEEGDTIFVLLEQTTRGKVEYAIRMARFANISNRNSDIKVCVNYTLSYGRGIECEWVDVNSVFEKLDDALAFCDKQGEASPHILEG